MLPLWDNVVCKQGICLLIELISNDDLDPHSRLLLTSSVLFGIPKKNSDVRPLAIRDEFLKLAERVCLAASELTGAQRTAAVVSIGGAGVRLAARVDANAPEIPPESRLEEFAHVAGQVLRQKNRAV